MATIAFCGSKGGTLKTASVLSFAADAARRGLRVAVVDCDPQGSATIALPDGSAPVDPDTGVRDLVPADLVADPLSAPPIPILLEDLAPAGGALVLYRGGDALDGASPQQVRDHVRRAHERVHLVVVDTQPRARACFGPMAAADLVVVPTDPTSDAMRNIAQYVAARDAVAPDTPLRLLLTKTVANERTTKQAPAILEENYPGALLATQIPNSARGKEANQYLLPTVLYATRPEDRVIRHAYLSLTTELLALVGLGPANVAGPAPQTDPSAPRPTTRSARTRGARA